MDKVELSQLAKSIHERFGKKYHNQTEAFNFLEIFWLDDPTISAQVLFSLAAKGAGKKKSHASGDADSGTLKQGFFRNVRASRRRGDRRSKSKPFDRIR